MMDFKKRFEDVGTHPTLAEAYDAGVSSCDCYADALVRLAHCATAWCRLEDGRPGFRVWRCRFCQGFVEQSKDSEFITITDIPHTDCPVGIGQEIVKEKEKHETRRSS